MGSTSTLARRGRAEASGLVREPQGESRLRDLVGSKRMRARAHPTGDELATGRRWRRCIRLTTSTRSERVRGRSRWWLSSRRVGHEHHALLRRPESPSLVNATLREKTYCGEVRATRFPGRASPVGRRQEKNNNRTRECGEARAPIRSIADAKLLLSRYPCDHSSSFSVRLTSRASARSL
jgi:hypothetical protein